MLPPLKFFVVPIVVPCWLLLLPLPQSKTEQDHQKLVEVCMAFMQHDGYKAGNLMVDHNRTTVC